MWITRINSVGFCYSMFIKYKLIQQEVIEMILVIVALINLINLFKKMLKNYLQNKNFVV